MLVVELEKLKDCYLFKVYLLTKFPDREKMSTWVKIKWMIIR